MRSAGEASRELNRERRSRGGPARVRTAGRHQEVDAVFDDPISPLSFVAGAAILANACAVMQNGTTTRYNLAIVQWREFRASLAWRLTPSTSYGSRIVHPEFRRPDRGARRRRRVAPT